MSTISDDSDPEGEGEGAPVDRMGVEEETDQPVGGSRWSWIGGMFGAGKSSG
jgi:hypothetical protein